MRQGGFFFEEICFPVLRAGYGIVCGSLRFAAGLRFPAGFMPRRFVSRFSVYGFPREYVSYPQRFAGRPPRFFARLSLRTSRSAGEGGFSARFSSQKGRNGEEERGKTDKKLPKPTGQGRGCATVYGGIVFMIAQNVGRLPNSAEKSKKFEKSVAKPLTFQA